LTAACPAAARFARRGLPGLIKRQAERGTIGSQLQSLRGYLAAAGYEPAGE